MGPSLLAEFFVALELAAWHSQKGLDSFEARISTLCQREWQHGFEEGHAEAQRPPASPQSENWRKLAKEARTIAEQGDYPELSQNLFVYARALDAAADACDRLERDNTKLRELLATTRGIFTQIIEDCHDFSSDRMLRENACVLADRGIAAIDAALKVKP